MIDVQSETLIPLNRARDLAWFRGRSGGRISADAVRRWALRGLRGIQLESLRIGNTRYTTKEATLRFLARLNNNEHVAPHVTDRRNLEIAEANRSLDDAGIS